MKAVPRTLLFVFLALAFGGTAGAADFGLALVTQGEYASDAAGEGPGFSAAAVPWIYAALGKTAGLYVSGKVTFEYKREGEEWAPPLFELGRTELNFRPAQRIYLTLGRQRFSDRGEMIASGLFDGASGSIALNRFRLSAGVFYTGLLYKETAEILITEGDTKAYAAPLDYADPDSYFASRRVLAFAGAEFPDLSSRLGLSLNALAQFDLNDYETLHSQYFEARAELEALDSLRFTLTGIGGLAEAEGAELKYHFAAALGADWDVPGAFTDMLSAEFRWGGGEAGGRLGAFIPVSDIAQGEVLTPSLRGTMNGRVFYRVRPRRELAFSFGGICFWRTDVETFTDGELDRSSTSRYLGTELDGSLVWAFQSAFRLNAGGGLFFPGGAFSDGAGPRWKVNAGLMVSL